MFIFFNELKNTFNKKSIIVILFCALLSLLVALFAYNKSLYTGEIIDNEYKEIYGNKAIKQVLSYPDKYYGYLDNEKLTEAAKSHNENVDRNSKRSKPVYENLINSDATSMIYSFLYINANREKPLVEWKDDAYIPMNIPKNFYKLRNEEVLQQASKINATDKVEKMEEELNIPFYIDQTASFWRTILEFLTVLIIASMFISVIMTAQSFSETFENGVREIIIMSEEGKKYFAKYRILSTLIYSTVVYSATAVPYLCYMFLKIGVRGLKTDFQFISLFSSINANIGQVILYYMFAAWMGILSMVCLSLFLSSLLKKSYATGIVSILMIIITYVNNIFFRDGKNTFINKILSITPMNSPEYIFIFSKNQFLNLFGLLVNLAIATIIIYLIYITVFSILSAKVYKRIQK
ncbi:ABC transporter permease [Peptoniphilus lacrimalis]|uniref:ABC-type transport system involved in multi-copper enzyme maturation, permease component n=1 Tax=Peptoniphilus lacrimalis TaxID=33031 RepID=A0A379C3R8_9FIRM|nr:ABC transporter permease [Peptoniphilus lacrimalis]SUB56910.1 ABC-type transport system involved in multi-copper enzyme maturation, permease component [Peptoniphilus lacrimalis]